MKTYTAQRGFFEIGLGLALLAVFGGATAIAIELNQPDDDVDEVIACNTYSHDYLVERLDNGLDCE